jgi:hypothetical protein
LARRAGREPPCHLGEWCETPACKQAQDDRRREVEEHWLAQAEEDGWQAVQPGSDDCQHEYEEKIDAEGGDVDAVRTCIRCGREERQRLFNEPEPPNLPFA